MTTTRPHRRAASAIVGGALLLALAVGCEVQGLVATNAAGVGADAPDVLSQGYVDFTPASSADLRAALWDFFQTSELPSATIDFELPGPFGLPGRRLLAHVELDGTWEGSAQGDVGACAGEPCLFPHFGGSFGPALQPRVLSSLVRAPEPGDPPLGPGAFDLLPDQLVSPTLLNLFGIPFPAGFLPPEVGLVLPDASHRLAIYAAGPPAFGYRNTSEKREDKVKLFGSLPVPGLEPTATRFGLWFPLAIRFLDDAGTSVWAHAEADCGCVNNEPPKPKVPPEQAVTATPPGAMSLCRSLAEERTGLPFGNKSICDIEGLGGVKAKLSLREVRLWVGITVRRRTSKFELCQEWTKKFPLPGGKKTPDPSGFCLETVVDGEAIRGQDFEVSADLYVKDNPGIEYVCQPFPFFIVPWCDLYATDVVAGELQAALAGQTGNSLPRSVGAFARPFLTGDPDPGILGEPPYAWRELSAYWQTEMLKAAVGRTIAHWFWGPFGAFDNGATLPVTDVEFVPAEPGPGGCDAASDPACSVTDGTPGLFRAHFDADADGDGVLTPFDDYPLCDNAKHSDGDGIPDGCDPCPFTELNDEDGDGVCELDQAYDTLDNCPITRNTDQRNTNLLAETQGLPKDQAPNAIYGDACDPIPVARLQPLAHAEGVENDGIACGTYYGDRVRLQPTVSHLPESKREPDDYEPHVQDSKLLATQFRVCTKNSATQVNCHNPDDFLDARLDDASCATGCAIDEKPEHPYRRASVGVQRASKPCASAAACGLNGQCFHNECHTKNACASDGACGDGEKCIGGTCSAWFCFVDADCATGLICTVSPQQAVCAPKPCAAHADCFAGQACVAGSCTRRECAVDGDCGFGQICVNEARCEPQEGALPLKCDLGNFASSDVKLYYDRPFDASFAAQPVAQWCSEADLGRWQASGVLSADAEDWYPARLWVHAETTLWDAEHGPDLGNTYHDVQPPAFSCSVDLVALPEDGKYLIWPTLPDPDPSMLVAAEPGLLQGLPRVVLPGLDGTWGLLGEEGRLYASSRLGPALKARLASPDFAWVNAAEPSPFVGRGPTFPTAIALEPDGSRVVDHVQVAGAKLLSAYDRGLTDVETPLGSPHALGHVAVLSRWRGGLFVLGGLDPASGEPTREVWYAPLLAPRWIELDFDLRPERVLAATYAAETGELVVLDELGSEARLFALGVDSGESRELGRWPRHADHWDAVWLTLDEDGSILLTSSSRAGKEHVVSRLWLSPGEPPEVVGRRFRAKALALPPLVEPGGGYGFVELRPEPPKPPKPPKPGKPPKEKKKPKAELVFRPKLQLHDACWAELGEQL